MASSHLEMPGDTRRGRARPWLLLLLAGVLAAPGLGQESPPPAPVTVPEGLVWDRYQRRLLALIRNPPPDELLQVVKENRRLLREVETWTPHHACFRSALEAGTEGR